MAGILCTWTSRPELFFTPPRARRFLYNQGDFRQLTRIGEEVLQLVQQNRSYHFVVDRFGRVFRIVREEDVAYHSGNSVWADQQRVYVGLNTSFLGVAIQTQTRAGEDNCLGQRRANPRRTRADQYASKQIPHRGCELRYPRSGVYQSR